MPSPHAARADVPPGTPVEVRRVLTELARRPPDEFNLPSILTGLPHVPELPPLRDVVRPLDPGTIGRPIPIAVKQLGPLISGAARRASGVPPSARKTEVVWAEGSDELVVDPGTVTIDTADGVVVVHVPVECDETGPATISVTFAIGAPDRPAGMLAAAQRVPEGPLTVVSRWGDALTALAWSAVLEMANSLAGGTGTDRAGDGLIAGEMIATDAGIVIVPLARHRFGDDAG